LKLKKKKFLEENQVYLIYLLDDGITLQKKEFTVYLLEDLILLVENRENIIYHMYVLNLIAINIPDCPYLEQYSIQHSIQYCHIDKNGNTNLLICYESELIKSKWLEIINNIINERNQYLTKKIDSEK